MSALDIVLLCLIAGAVLLAVRSRLRARKQGKTCCSAGCCCCDGCAASEKDRKE